MIKFDHDAESFPKTLGIRASRGEDMVDSGYRAFKKMKAAGNCRRSEIFEKILKAVDPETDAELLLTGFIYGSLEADAIKSMKAVLPSDKDLAKMEKFASKIAKAVSKALEDDEDID